MEMGIQQPRRMKNALKIVIGKLQEITLKNLDITLRCVTCKLHRV
jgi:hypothetical protein